MTYTKTADKVLPRESSGRITKEPARLLEETDFFDDSLCALSLTS